MSGQVLLVPGTGGTKLLKNGESLGYPLVLNLKLWLLKSVGSDVSQTVKDMSMEHAKDLVAPVRTTLASDSKVVPGDVLTVAYNQILPKCDGVFTYDWRSCIENSATELVDYLESNTHKGKFRIVCHSQGGLVVIAASKIFETKHLRRSFSELVSHIAFVAVPLSGTLNAAHALLVGEQLGESASPEFKKIAGTWPALYEMLPSWYALRTPNGDYSRYSFFHTATWAPFKWTEPDLVVRAWNVRKRLLNHPVTNLQGIRYTFYLARNRKTWSYATRHDNGEITFGARLAEGDSLVPYKVTYSMMSDVEQQRCHILGPEENNPEHAFVLDGDWITTRVMEDFKA